MRIILCASGIFTAILLTLLLSGWASVDDKIKAAARQGNRLYEEANYNDALKAYETGLEAAPENKVLNFNAAQTAYLIGEYEKAVEYYEKSEDSTEKFLNYGNISFRSGDAAEDANQKIQLYGQALEIYKQGITKYPQDVPLKYNYERAKEKLDELLQDMENENDQDGENDESEENQQQDSQQDDESEEGQNQQGNDDEQQDGDNQQQEEDSQQQESDSQQQEGQQQDGDSQQEDSQQQDGEVSPDEEAIQRILEMLENQEEQSLKNNQEVVGGKEGTNGW